MSSAITYLATKLGVSTTTATLILITVFLAVVGSISYALYIVLKTDDVVEVSARMVED